MELWSNIVEGFSGLLGIDTIIILCLAIVIGLVGGIIPGISGPMLVVVFLPVTFAMEPHQAFVLLSVLYVTSVYGGMVTAILFRAPGSPESAVTALDGYAMREKGLAGRALGIGILSSGVGALVATVAMILLTAPLATLALSFSSAEFFAISVLGLSIVASLSSGKVAKGIFGVGMGMLLATVGTDPMTSEARFAFGSAGLAAGLALVPVMIGLFAIPEVLRKSRLENKPKKEDPAANKIEILSRDNIREAGPTAARSSVVGVLLGLLPGAGSITASVLGYSQAVKFAKDKSQFGKGDPRGVAGPESANNAGAVGSLVPLFALGIPGSAATAILIGAFVLHGFQPGPNFMTNQSSIVYTVFAAIIVANLLALVLAKPFISSVSKILRIPYSVLASVVIIFSMLGAYSMRNSIFDITIMLVFGAVGYFLLVNKFPVAPIILGFVLGPIAESHFRRALIMAGEDVFTLLSRPIAGTVIAVAVVVLLMPLLTGAYKKLRPRTGKRDPVSA